MMARASAHRLDWRGEDRRYLAIELGNGVGELRFPYGVCGGLQLTAQSRTRQLERLDPANLFRVRNRGLARLLAASLQFLQAFLDFCIGVDQSFAGVSHRISRGPSGAG